MRINGHTLVSGTPLEVEADTLEAALALWKREEERIDSQPAVLVVQLEAHAPANDTPHGDYSRPGVEPWWERSNA